MTPRRQRTDGPMPLLVPLAVLVAVLLGRAGLHRSPVRAITAGIRRRRLRQGVAMIPRGWLEHLRERSDIVRIAERHVVWDSRKSNPAKGDMWACCPFHAEKTPSFHVDRDQGSFKCFGCGEGGDILEFVRKTGNMDFAEAVQTLADEAGMVIPERDPTAARKAADAKRLIGIVGEAAAFHRAGLRRDTPGAKAARKHLEERGLDGAAWDRWGLGYAPGGFAALVTHLRGKGVSDDDMRAAGLAKDGPRGLRDVFVDRIMIPIDDARGRKVAFGGRAMDPDSPAKYLNSPNTAVFDKRRTLFNHTRARQGVSPARGLLVVEGYFDVISMTEAGFRAVVAPLGTAVTDEQLGLAWRMHHTPVLCFDGDAAGRRAAHKTAENVLPLLRAGKGLAFAALPEGRDPHDLVREGGRTALRPSLLDLRTVPDMLWERETEGMDTSSPDRRAGLRKTLRGLLGRIPDGDTREEYRLHLASRMRSVQPFHLDGPTAGRFDSELDATAPEGETRAQRARRMNGMQNAAANAWLDGRPARERDGSVREAAEQDIGGDRGQAAGRGDRARRDGEGGRSAASREGTGSGGNVRGPDDSALDLDDPASENDSAALRIACVVTERTSSDSRVHGMDLRAELTGLLDAARRAGPELQPGESGPEAERIAEDARKIAGERVAADVRVSEAGKIEPASEFAYRARIWKTPEFGDPDKDAGWRDAVGAAMERASGSEPEPDEWLAARALRVADTLERRELAGAVAAALCLGPARDTAELVAERRGLVAELERDPEPGDDVHGMARRLYRAFTAREIAAMAGGRAGAGVARGVARVHVVVPAERAPWSGLFRQRSRETLDRMARAVMMAPGD